MPFIKLFVVLVTAFLIALIKCLAKTVQRNTEFGSEFEVPHSMRYKSSWCQKPEKRALYCIFRVETDEHDTPEALSFP